MSWNMKMKSVLVQERSWTDLSPEPLQIINDKLHNKIVRAVCKKWGSSVPPPFKQLHHLLPLTLQIHECGSFLNITTPAIRLLPTGVFLLRRSGCPTSSWWMVSMEQPGGPESPLRLFHPLTKSRIPFEILPEIHPDLDSVKLMEGCNLRYTDNGASVFKPLPELFYVSKVLLWRDPFGLHNYSIVKLHSRGKNLECFRLPYSENQGVYNFKNCIKISLHYDDEEEEEHNQGFTSIAIDDIEIWNGMLWALNCQGKVFGITYEELKVSVVAGGDISATSGRGAKRLLVTKLGLSMVVCNNTLDHDEFTVYLLNSEKNWDKFNTLGEWNILFVSYDRCFFATRDELDWFPGNTIVYPKNLYPCFSDKKPRDGVEFLGEEDYLDLRMHKYGHGGNYTIIPRCPNLASVFWPPPMAIFKKSSSPRSNPGITVNYVPKDADAVDQPGNHTLGPAFLDTEVFPTSYESFNGVDVQPFSGKRKMYVR